LTDDGETAGTGRLSEMLNIQDIDSERRRMVNAAEAEVAELKRINSEIERLLEMRFRHVSRLTGVSNALCSCERVLGYSAQTVIDGWTENGFRSDIVRNAVASVRRMFLDDSISEFKKFNCIDIDRTESLAFKFSKKDAEFSIYMPPEGFASDRKVNTFERFVGEFGLSFSWAGVTPMFGVIRSFYVSDIRDKLLKYVLMPKEEAELTWTSMLAESLRQEEDRDESQHTLADTVVSYFEGDLENNIR